MREGVKNYSVLKTKTDTIIKREKKFKSDQKTRVGEIFKKSAKSYLSSHLILQTQKSRSIMKKGEVIF